MALDLWWRSQSGWVIMTGPNTANDWLIDRKQSDLEMVSPFILITGISAKIYIKNINGVIRLELCVIPVF